MHLKKDCYAAWAGKRRKLTNGHRCKRGRPEADTQERGKYLKLQGKSVIQEEVLGTLLDDAKNFGRFEH